MSEASCREIVCLPVSTRYDVCMCIPKRVRDRDNYVMQIMSSNFVVFHVSFQKKFAWNFD